MRLRRKPAFVSNVAKALVGGGEQLFGVVETYVQEVFERRNTHYFAKNPVKVRGRVTRQRRQLAKRYLFAEMFLHILQTARNKAVVALGVQAYIVAVFHAVAADIKKQLHEFCRHEITVLVAAGL